MNPRPLGYENTRKVVSSRKEATKRDSILCSSRQLLLPVAARSLHFRSTGKRQTAAQFEAVWANQPGDKTPQEIAKHEEITAGFWERATLPWIHKHEYLPHWPLVLSALLLPPILCYVLLALVIRTGRRVARGFRVDGR